MKYNCIEKSICKFNFFNLFQKRFIHLNRNHIIRPSKSVQVVHRKQRFGLDHYYSFFIAPFTKFKMICNNVCARRSSIYAISSAE